ncbi:M24 family metallopeptidase [Pseudooceanicola algae]|uniref:Putative dipeptidase PepE n=1 Tax=Pseudooceanicola algae TaxID=1537215 RepID=A0A418SHT5_9RHOB|nr:Xaa-Pro peptidase family protein [Pseudooceanicola algae]QPM90226.1 putative dipeptidase PepE [Pseudooceanicola algae]
MTAPASSPLPTPRGFPEAELRARTAAAQARMAEAGLEALLLTTEPALRYFTGFLTRFWGSPTRPWFLVIPASGDPVAVIPAIGAHLMGQSWISDVRSWSSPEPGDTGLRLLSDCLVEKAPEGRVGLPSGPETHLRLPLSDWARLRALLPRHHFTDDAEILADLRLLKSPAEVAKIETACAIATRAFDRVPEIAGPGVALDQVFRRFQMLCLEEGADWVPYLAGGAGPGGYGDVISPATPAPLQKGDVLMLDTGLCHDGYFCDFDRNFSVGAPSPETVRAHARLIGAARAGFDLARPGATFADLFGAMNRVLTPGGTTPGRLGHGLGMELTEGPSIVPWEGRDLQPGMVLTLEPLLTLPSGQVMVHEENILITPTGARWLSRPSGPEIALLPVPEAAKAAP